MRGKLSSFCPPDRAVVKILKDKMEICTALGEVWNLSWPGRSLAVNFSKTLCENGAHSFTFVLLDAKGRPLNTSLELNRIGVRKREDGGAGATAHALLCFLGQGKDAD